jgi:MFS family permease
MSGLAPTQPEQASHRGWWMVFVLFLLYVFSWVDRLILSMMVDPIKASLSLNDYEIGLVMTTSFAVATSLFGIPTGWLVDRFPRRIILFVGVMMWSIATWLSGHAQSYAQLLAFRVLVGIGETVIVPCAYSLIADAMPREQLTRANASFQMGGKTGSAVSFALGGPLIAFAATAAAAGLPLMGGLEPWQRVMVMVGLPGLVLAFLAFSFPEPARRSFIAHDPADKKGELRRFLKANATLVIIMMISFSCLASVGYTLTSWVPTFMSRHFGWQPAQYGPVVAILNLISAASLVVNGVIVDKLFARGMKDAHMRFYSWLMLIVSPAAIGMFLIDSAWPFLAMYCVVQFVTVPFIVYVAGIVALVAPNTIRATLIAMFQFVFTMVGLGVGPAVVGALSTFLYNDPKRIGDAMFWVIVVSFILGFITMRMGLAPLRRAMDGLTTPDENA